MLALIAPVGATLTLCAHTAATKPAAGSTLHTTLNRRDPTGLAYNARGLGADASDPGDELGNALST
jgi:hypothetical protein